MTAALRPAVPGDLDAMAAVEAAVFGPAAWSRDQLTDELARLSDTRWYVVAVSPAGELAGYAGLYLSPPDADVQTVAVAAAHQGHGVGRALVAALVEHAWQVGCTRLFLEVSAANERALGLYQAAGFRRLGRRPRYYPDGSDAVTMRLRRSEAPTAAEAAHG